ncbi:MAG: hypothetical protein K2G32_07560, partial [Oscillospiraceae bacterium]|nr:hypothetical protein [Oscillospiraceae bacterium]
PLSPPPFARFSLAISGFSGVIVFYVQCSRAPVIDVHRIVNLSKFRLFKLQSSADFVIFYQVVDLVKDCYQLPFIIEKNAQKSRYPLYNSIKI